MVEASGLRELRKAKGLTQSKACARVRGELSSTQLSQVERGLRPPKRRWAMYARAYGVSRDEFVRLAGFDVA